MKIGYFLTKFPYSQSYEEYEYGGAAVAAYYLAIELIKKDHEAYVFTTSIDSKDSIERHRNLTVYRYGTNFKILASNISFGMFRKPLKQDVDLIHVHFDLPPGPFAGLEYAKKKKVPMIITYHGDWDAGYGGFIRRIGTGLHNIYLVDKLLSRCDVIISPSRSYINRSKFLYKYKEKIVVIPNGISMAGLDNPFSKDECRERLGLSLDEKIVLFVGSLSEYKGPDVLIKAMPKVLTHISNTRLIFVGRGILKQELERLSKKLGIEKNVVLTGFVEDGIKHLFYKAADVFCLPSTMSTEIFGIVNLEAMAFGLPIVACDVGGIPDLVESKKNGLLVPPNNSEALADAITYLLNNNDIRKAMGMEGKKKVKNYSWGSIAQQTEKVYGNVI